MERSSADSMIAAYARHADRRVRCHLAIEADLALVHVRRLVIDRNGAPDEPYLLTGMP